MASKDLQMIADRWMMESRRLVNWGSYEGYHEFRPSMDRDMPVTLLAGASESGKSTLVDAQNSLLYPTGTPFNKASNSGRSERSDYTYLRGMVGVSGGADGDEPIYLRGRDDDGAPQAVWGAIVDTYRNQVTGQVISCGKFMYLMPGDGRGDVRRQYVVWDRPMDPRLMDAYRRSPFTPSQLRAVYDQCTVFPSAETFHEHIWSIMGLTAEACRLLARIQSADAPSRLDDIFKQGVLGVPEALALSRDIVDDYDRYAQNFRSMEEKARRMARLKAIRDGYARYEEANRRAGTLAAVDPRTEEGKATVRRWTIEAMADEVRAQMPSDRAALGAYTDQAGSARRRVDDLRSRIDAIRDRMRLSDGADLARLEYEHDAAQRALRDVKESRRRVEQRFQEAGQDMPADAKSWEEARIEAVNFTRMWDTRMEELETSRNEAFTALAEAKEELRRLSRDYERQQAQRTRITRQMDESRAMLCKAVGLAPEDMPYVAELMDVRDDEEQWRLAMNVVYSPISQTILVDSRHERGFAAKVSAIDPHAMTRRTWRFVDVSTGEDSGAAHDDGPSHDGDDEDKTVSRRHGGNAWMSSKLRFREDSPFVGWLREQTRSERFDALCVDAIDDTVRDGRQVQPDGQIKSGDRGQYGVKDRAQVIGFVNGEYLEQLQERIGDAQKAVQEAQRSYEDVKANAQRLQAEHELAKLLAYTSWDRIDVEAAQRQAIQLGQAIEAANSGAKSAGLADMRNEMTAQLAQAEQLQAQAERHAADASAAVEAAVAWLRWANEATAGAQEDAARTGVTAAIDSRGSAPSAVSVLSETAVTALRESYERMMSGLPDAQTRAHMIIGAGASALSGKKTTAGSDDATASGAFAERTVAGIGSDLTGRIGLLDGAVDNARNAVEMLMSAYIREYAADDDSLSPSVDDYRYYLDELNGLSRLSAADATGDEYRRCLKQLLMSLLTVKRAIDTDAGDIRDQLDRINRMLDGQQFGPRHGSLSLHADVRRPDRAFCAQLKHAITVLNDWKMPSPVQIGTRDAADGQTPDDTVATAKRVFAQVAPMIELLRHELAQVKDMNGVKSYGARNLDPRCRSSFYANVHHEDGPDERITSTGGRSGGALQELTSFVYGAALIYLLGGGMEQRLRPSYTTLFLDEALIKADGRYTKRALSVLPRLGFQVIVSAPESKTGELLEMSSVAYVTYKDPDTGLTSLREASLDAARRPDDEPAA